MEFPNFNFNAGTKVPCFCLLPNLKRFSARSSFPNKGPCILMSLRFYNLVITLVCHLLCWEDNIIINCSTFFIKSNSSLKIISNNNGVTVEYHDLHHA